MQNEPIGGPFMLLAMNQELKKPLMHNIGFLNLKTYLAYISLISNKPFVLKSKLSFKKTVIFYKTNLDKQMGCVKNYLKLLFSRTKIAKRLAHYANCEKI